MPGEKRIAGGCMCGNIRFSFSGTPKWVLHCHCESCRRATSSPMTTWLSVAHDSYQLDRGNPSAHVSSPGARRTFCPDCGSPMSFTHQRFPDETHLYVASLDDPDAFLPTKHVFFGERLLWAELHDVLPRFDGTSGKGRSPDSHGPAAE
jgi:hypothetical protein